MSIALRQAQGERMSGGNAQRPLMLSLSKQARGLCSVMLLAACSNEAGQQVGDHSANGGDHIRCALRRASQAKPDCTREVARGPDGEVWVIRHPDGGFRRFVLIDNGTRIATADGAEEVRAARVGADLEVRVAGERYLFPAAADAAR